ncbi:MAG: alpha-glucuronidase family glycosyl hydrolase [Verrucomicrobia bacterium]|nr:alpha-glucuronidase family glycosyl hydrolase [Verrucomicrobiota bacterium]
MKTTVVCSQEKSPLETLAVREVCRYIFQRTGQLPPVVTGKPPWKFADSSIVIGRKDRDHVAAVLLDPQLKTAVAALQSQQYILKTIEVGGRRVLLVVGGDDIGTLYGGYRLAECLGVRFYVHGDVIPDARLHGALPNLDELGQPLFALRGIQPFNNFAFGPDWWTVEDYKAIIGQLAKMRMNFIGFHCYPEYPGTPNPEKC